MHSIESGWPVVNAVILTVRLPPFIDAAKGPNPFTCFSPVFEINVEVCIDCGVYIKALELGAVRDVPCPRSLTNDNMWKLSYTYIP